MASSETPMELGSSNDDLKADEEAKVTDETQTAFKDALKQLFTLEKKMRLEMQQNLRDLRLNMTENKIDLVVRKANKLYQIRNQLRTSRTLFKEEKKIMKEFENIKMLLAQCENLREEQWIQTKSDCFTLGQKLSDIRKRQNRLSGQVRELEAVISDLLTMPFDDIDLDSCDLDVLQKEEAEFDAMFPSFSSYPLFNSAPYGVSPKATPTTSPLTDRVLNQGVIKRSSQPPMESESFWTPAPPQPQDMSKRKSSDVSKSEGLALLEIPGQTELKKPKMSEDAMVMVDGKLVTTAEAQQILKEKQRRFELEFGDETKFEPKINYDEYSDAVRDSGNTDFGKHDKEMNNAVTDQNERTEDKQMNVVQAPTRKKKKVIKTKKTNESKLAEEHEKNAKSPTNSKVKAKKKKTLEVKNEEVTKKDKATPDKENVNKLAQAGNDVAEQGMSAEKAITDHSTEKLCSEPDNEKQCVGIEPMKSTDESNNRRKDELPEMLVALKDHEYKENKLSSQATKSTEQEICEDRQEFSEQTGEGSGNLKNELKNGKSESEEHVVKKGIIISKSDVDQKEADIKNEEEQKCLQFIQDSQMEDPDSSTQKSQVSMERENLIEEDLEEKHETEKEKNSTDESNIASREPETDVKDKDEEKEVLQGCQPEDNIGLSAQKSLVTFPTEDSVQDDQKEKYSLVELNVSQEESVMTLEGKQDEAIKDSMQRDNASLQETETTPQTKTKEMVQNDRMEEEQHLLKEDEDINVLTEQIISETQLDKKVPQEFLEDTELCDKSKISNIVNEERIAMENKHENITNISVTAHKQADLESEEENFEENGDRQLKNVQDTKYESKMEIQEDNDETVKKSTNIQLEEEGSKKVISVIEDESDYLEELKSNKDVEAEIGNLDTESKKPSVPENFEQETDLKSLKQELPIDEKVVWNDNGSTRKELIQEGSELPENDSESVQTHPSNVLEKSQILPKEIGSQRNEKSEKETLVHSGAQDADNEPSEDNQFGKNQIEFDKSERVEELPMKPPRKRTEKIHPDLEVTESEITSQHHQNLHVSTEEGTFCSKIQKEDIVFGQEQNCNEKDTEEEQKVTESDESLPKIHEKFDLIVEIKQTSQPTESERLEQTPENHVKMEQFSSDKVDNPSIMEECYPTEIAYVGNDGGNLKQVEEVQPMNSKAFHFEPEGVEESFKNQPQVNVDLQSKGEGEVSECLFEEVIQRSNTETTENISHSQEHYDTSVHSKELLPESDNQGQDTNSYKTESTDNLEHLSIATDADVSLAPHKKDIPKTTENICSHETQSTGTFVSVLSSSATEILSEVHEKQKKESDGNEEVSKENTHEEPTEIFDLSKGKYDGETDAITDKGNVETELLEETKIRGAVNFPIEINEPGSLTVADTITMPQATDLDQSDVTDFDHWKEDNEKRCYQSNQIVMDVDDESILNRCNNEICDGTVIQDKLGKNDSFLYENNVTKPNLIPNNFENNEDVISRNRFKCEISNEKEITHQGHGNDKRVEEDGYDKTDIQEEKEVSLSKKKEELEKRTIREKSVEENPREMDFHGNEISESTSGKRENEELQNNAQNCYQTKDSATNQSENQDKDAHEMVQADFADTGTSFMLERDHELLDDATKQNAVENNLDEAEKKKNVEHLFVNILDKQNEEEVDTHLDITDISPNNSSLETDSKQPTFPDSSSQQHEHKTSNSTNFELTFSDTDQAETEDEKCGLVADKIFSPQFEKANENESLEPLKAEDFQNAQKVFYDDTNNDFKEAENQRETGAKLKKLSYFSEPETLEESNEAMIDREVMIMRLIDEGFSEEEAVEIADEAIFVDNMQDIGPWNKTIEQDIFDYEDDESEAQETMWRDNIREKLLKEMEARRVVQTKEEDELANTSGELVQLSKTKDDFDQSEVEEFSEITSKPEGAKDDQVTFDDFQNPIESFGNNFEQERNELAKEQLETPSKTKRKNKIPQPSEQEDISEEKEVTEHDIHKMEDASNEDLVETLPLKAPRMKKVKQVGDMASENIPDGKKVSHDDQEKNIPKVASKYAHNGKDGELKSEMSYSGSDNFTSESKNKSSGRSKSEEELRGAKGSVQGNESETNTAEVNVVGKTLQDSEFPEEYFKELVTREKEITHPEKVSPIEEQFPQKRKENDVEEPEPYELIDDEFPQAIKPFKKPRSKAKPSKNDVGITNVEEKELIPESEEMTELQKNEAEEKEEKHSNNQHEEKVDKPEKPVRVRPKMSTQNVTKIFHEKDATLDEKIDDDKRTKELAQDQESFEHEKYEEPSKPERSSRKSGSQLKGPSDFTIEFDAVDQFKKESDFETTQEASEKAITQEQVLTDGEMDSHKKKVLQENKQVLSQHKTKEQQIELKETLVLPEESLEKTSTQVENSTDTTALVVKSVGIPSSKETCHDIVPEMDKIVPESERVPIKPEKTKKKPKFLNTNQNVCEIDPSSELEKRRNTELQEHNAGYLQTHTEPKYKTESDKGHKDYQFDREVLASEQEMETAQKNSTLLLQANEDDSKTESQVKPIIKTRLKMKKPTDIDSANLNLIEKVEKPSDSEPIMQDVGSEQKADEYQFQSHNTKKPRSKKDLIPKDGKTQNIVDSNFLEEKVGREKFEEPIYSVPQKSQEKIRRLKEGENTVEQTTPDMQKLNQVEQQKQMYLETSFETSESDKEDKVIDHENYTQMPEVTERKNKGKTKQTKESLSKKRDNETVVDHGSQFPTTEASVELSKKANFSKTKSSITQKEKEPENETKTKALKHQLTLSDTGASIKSDSVSEITDISTGSQKVSKKTKDKSKQKKETRATSQLKEKYSLKTASDFAPLEIEDSKADQDDDDDDDEFSKGGKTKPTMSIGEFKKLKAQSAKEKDNVKTKEKKTPISVSAVKAFFSKNIPQNKNSSSDREKESYTIKNTILSDNTREESNVEVETSSVAKSSKKISAKIISNTSGQKLSDVFSAISDSSLRFGNLRKRKEVQDKGDIDNFQNCNDQLEDQDTEYNSDTESMKEISLNFTENVTETNFSGEISSPIVKPSRKRQRSFSPSTKHQDINKERSDEVLTLPAVPKRSRSLSSQRKSKGNMDDKSAISSNSAPKKESFKNEINELKGLKSAQIDQYEGKSGDERVQNVIEEPIKPTIPSRSRSSSRGRTRTKPKVFDKEKQDHAQSNQQKENPSKSELQYLEHEPEEQSSLACPCIPKRSRSHSRKRQETEVVKPPRQRSSSRQNFKYLIDEGKNFESNNINFTEEEKAGQLELLPKSPQRSRRTITASSTRNLNMKSQSQTQTCSDFKISSESSFEDALEKQEPISFKEPSIPERKKGRSSSRGMSDEEIVLGETLENQTPAPTPPAKGHRRSRSLSTSKHASHVMKNRNLPQELETSMNPTNDIEQRLQQSSKKVSFSETNLKIIFPPDPEVKTLPGTSLYCFNPSSTRHQPSLKARDTLRLINDSEREKCLKWRPQDTYRPFVPDSPPEKEIPKLVETNVAKETNFDPALCSPTSLSDSHFQEWLPQFRYKPFVPDAPPPKEAPELLSSLPKMKEEDKTKSLPTRGSNKKKSFLDQISLPNDFLKALHHKDHGDHEDLQNNQGLTNLQEVPSEGNHHEVNQSIFGRALLRKKFSTRGSEKNLSLLLPKSNSFILPSSSPILATPPLERLSKRKATSNHMDARSMGSAEIFKSTKSLGDDTNASENESESLFDFFTRRKKKSTKASTVSMPNFDELFAQANNAQEANKKQAEKEKAIANEKKHSEEVDFEDRELFSFETSSKDESFRPTQRSSGIGFEEKVKCFLSDQEEQLKYQKDPLYNDFTKVKISDFNNDKPFSFACLGPPVLQQQEQLQSGLKSGQLTAENIQNTRNSRAVERVKENEGFRSLQQSPTSTLSRPKLKIKSRDSSQHSLKRGSKRSEVQPEEFLKRLKELVKVADIEDEEHGDNNNNDPNRNTAIEKPNVIRPNIVNGQNMTHEISGDKRRQSFQPSSGSSLLPPSAPPRRASIAGQDGALPPSYRRRSASSHSSSSMKRADIPITIPADTHLPKTLIPDSMMQGDDELGWFNENQIINFDERMNDPYGRKLGRAEFGSLKKRNESFEQEKIPDRQRPSDQNRSISGDKFAPSPSIIEKKKEVLQEMSEQEKAIKKAKDWLMMASMSAICVSVMVFLQNEGSVL